MSKLSSNSIREYERGLLLIEYTFPLPDKKSLREEMEQLKERQRYLKFEELYKISKPYQYEKLIETVEIMAWYQRELNNLERIIKSGCYKHMKEYPSEIQRLLEIRKSIMVSGYKSSLKASLLNKTIDILHEYLIRGGKLNQEDVKDFVYGVVDRMNEKPRTLLEIDISKVLPSFSYTEQEVQELNSLIDEYIDLVVLEEVGEKPTDELRKFMRNEFLLAELLVRL